MKRYCWPVLFFFLFSCSYKISDKQLKEFCGANSATLQIYFRETDKKNERVYYHTGWLFSLYVNDVKYFSQYQAKAGETLNICVPAGKVKIAYSLVSDSQDSTGSRFFTKPDTLDYRSLDSKPLELFLQPNEKIRLRVKNTKKSTVLSSAGSGMIYVPVPAEIQAVSLEVSRRKFIDDKDVPSPEIDE